MGTPKGTPETTRDYIRRYCPHCRHVTYQYPQPKYNPYNVRDYPRTRNSTICVNCNRTVY